MQFVPKTLGRAKDIAMLRVMTIETIPSCLTVPTHKEYTGPAAKFGMTLVARNTLSSNLFWNFSLGHFGKEHWGQRLQICCTPQHPCEVPVLGALDFHLQCQSGWNNFRADESELALHDPGRGVMRSTGKNRDARHFCDRTRCEKGALSRRVEWQMRKMRYAVVWSMGLATYADVGAVGSVGFLTVGADIMYKYPT